MPAIVDFSTIVQEALTVFGSVFDTEAARRHCAEYLTGLMVAERTTVSGINREFAVPTDQSCVNRWLPAVEGDVHTWHDRRLAWLQQAPQTRDSVRGVMAIDHTLVDHEGKLIEDVGKCWDHADQRYIIAHDSIISNYVCTSGAHYPIEWRRFKKRDACAAGEFKDHTELCIELIDDAVRRGIPGDFTCDSSFTSAKVLNHMQRQQRAYVGDLKHNRKVVYAGREQKLQDVAREIPWEANKPGRGGATDATGTSANRCASLRSIIRCESCCFGASAGTRKRAKRWSVTAWGGKSYGGCWCIVIAGQGPRPFIETASSSWAWETVRCAAARGRPATCISSAQRTVS